MQLSEISISDLANLINDYRIVLAILVPNLIGWILVVQAIKCLLRTEMLRIYYHNEEKGEIRQYEMQNFILLHKAYKFLRGNSFIDEIYDKIKKWRIVT